LRDYLVNLGAVILREILPLNKNTKSEIRSSKQILKSKILMTKTFGILDLENYLLFRISIFDIRI